MVMEKRARRHRSQAERRQIVEETLVAGASVARIARAHELNANQVFHWRKLYREGRLGEGDGAKLLPVRLEESAAMPVAKAQSGKAGIIDVDLGHARVRIEGTADPACVRAALEALRR
jgi:transposase